MTLTMNFMNAAGTATAMRAWHQMFEIPHAVAAHSTKMMLSSAFFGVAIPGFTDSIHRAMDLNDTAFRRYRPALFDVPGTTIRRIDASPFFELLHFDTGADATRPRVLLLAPMSGHDASVLNDTIKGLCRDHDVYVSAPICASQVPHSAGEFSLDRYIAGIQHTIRRFQGNIHVIAVSQPGPLLLAALSLMESARDPFVPRSASFIGCPIDPHINPTRVNRLTVQHGVEFFRRHAIAPVASGNPGFGRKVYPGVLQMGASACMGANAGEEKYKNVGIADLDARYFLETIDRVFVKAQLPRGEMVHIDVHGRETPVNPAAIHRIGLLTVEGDNDEIVGAGQTRAALELATSLPLSRKMHHVEQGAGHYGIIHGPRWQNGVLPRVTSFIQREDSFARMRDLKCEILAAE